MFFTLGIETNPTLKIAYLISAGWGEAVNRKNEGRGGKVRGISRPGEDQRVDFPPPR
jgi:hypothetical protein